MSRPVFFSIDGPYAGVEVVDVPTEITPMGFKKLLYDDAHYAPNFSGIAINQVKLLNEDRVEVDTCTFSSMASLGLGLNKLSPVFLTLPPEKEFSSDNHATPIDRFTALLAESGSYKVSEDTLLVLKFKLFNALPNVQTPREALQLYNFAEQYPHRTTVDRFEKFFHLIINGPHTPMTATTPAIMCAYHSETGAPKMLKFDSDADYSTYIALGLDQDTALLHHIVHIEGQVKDVRGKTAIIMKPYPGVLESVPHLPAHLVLRGVQQIQHALAYMHSKGFAHCDVKTGNILLDEAGNWFLCDLGSAMAIDRPGVVLPTARYVPTDAKVEATAAFDHLLLVVAAVTVVDPEALGLAARFSMEAVRRAVESVKVYAPDLYDALTALLPVP